MAQHNDLGRIGENLAEKYLVNHDFKIVERDWRLGHNDIDLIAWDGNELVFIEIKTRRSNKCAEPEEWVDLEKQRSYVRLADYYVTKNNIEEEVRFDIIGIILNAQRQELHHLRRAFDASSVKAARNAKRQNIHTPLETNHNAMR
ncbi:MAG: YraN family protein [Bacteroidales bacterium]|nr:YraN family protein [Bacteroidales bacterium]